MSKGRNPESMYESVYSKAIWDTHEMVLVDEALSSFLLFLDAPNLVFQKTGDGSWPVNL